MGSGKANNWTSTLGWWTDIVLMESDGRMHQYKGLICTPYIGTHLQIELASQRMIQS